MSTETNAAPTETKPKTARKRARKPSTVTNDFLGQKRAEMTTKAKELDKDVKSLKNTLRDAEERRNIVAAELMNKTNEHDRVVAGLAAIDKAVAISSGAAAAKKS